MASASLKPVSRCPARLSQCDPAFEIARVDDVEQHVKNQVAQPLLARLQRALVFTPCSDVDHRAGHCRPAVVLGALAVDLEFDDGAVAPEPLHHVRARRRATFEPLPQPGIDGVAIVLLHQREDAGQGQQLVLGISEHLGEPRIGIGEAPVLHDVDTHEGLLDQGLIRGGHAAVEVRHVCCGRPTCARRSANRGGLAGLVAPSPSYAAASTWSPMARLSVTSIAVPSRTVARPSSSPSAENVTAPRGLLSAPTARTTAVRRTECPTTARAGDVVSVVLVDTATDGGATGGGGGATACEPGGAASASPAAGARRTGGGLAARLTAPIARLACSGGVVGVIATGSLRSAASGGVTAELGKATLSAGAAQLPGSSTRWPHPCDSIHATVRWSGPGSLPKVPEVRLRELNSQRPTRTVPMSPSDRALMAQPDNPLAFGEPVAEGADGEANQDDDEDHAEQVDGVSKQRHQQRQAGNQPENHEPAGDVLTRLEPGGGRSRPIRTPCSYLVETPLLAGRVPDSGAP